MSTNQEQLNHEPDVHDLTEKIHKIKEEVEHINDFRYSTTRWITGVIVSVLIFLTSIAWYAGLKTSEFSTQINNMSGQLTDLKTVFSHETKMFYEAKEANKDFAYIDKQIARLEGRFDGLEKCCSAKGEMISDIKTEIRLLRAEKAKGR